MKEVTVQPIYFVKSSNFMNNSSIIRIKIISVDSGLKQQYFKWQQSGNY